MVCTPPISAIRPACLGKPPTSRPTSDVVPPTSITTASWREVMNAAPRMELVGPDEKVPMGSRSATAVGATVPSFWVR